MIFAFLAYTRLICPANNTALITGMGHWPVRSRAATEQAVAARAVRRDERLAAIASNLQRVKEARRGSEDSAQVLADVKAVSAVTAVSAFTAITSVTAINSVTAITAVKSSTRSSMYIEVSLVNLAVQFSSVQFSFMAMAW